MHFRDLVFDSIEFHNVFLNRCQAVSLIKVNSYSRNTFVKKNLAQRSEKENKWVRSDDYMEWVADEGEPRFTLELVLALVICKNTKEFTYKSTARSLGYYKERRLLILNGGVTHISVKTGWFTQQRSKVSQISRVGFGILL